MKKQIVEETLTLKIAASGNAKSIAGAIIENLKKAKMVKVRAIGAGAVNQSVKAIIIAGSMGKPIGINFTIDPAFVDIDFDGQNKSAIQFVLRKEI